MHKEPPTDTPGWGLPAALADAIEPPLPGLGSEIIETISVEVPEYARPLEGSFGRGVRRGVEQALSQFTATIRDPSTGRGAGREVYVELGRGEFRQGRRLDSLLAAYRVGARVAWRRLSAAAEGAGFPPSDVYALADAIFAYIDELSAESAEGYAAEQSARQDQARISRDRLLAALLSSEPPAPQELERLAAEAGWQPPRSVVALACPVEQLADVDRILPAGTISGAVGGLGCVLAEAPVGPRAVEELRRTCGETQVTMGMATPWLEALRSWRDAREVQGMRRDPGLPPKGLLATDEILAPTVLMAARDRLNRLHRRRLAPMDEETPASRRRLLETLLALLRNQGRIAETARALHVHPQTVRYRLSRLRELLGDAIDDPDERFELELALRAEALGPGEL